MKRILIKIIMNYRMYKLRRKGLQIDSDCTIMPNVIFGSEPYLISLAAKVTISNHVTFITHDGGTRVFRENERYKSVIKYGRITIHENCFIGSGTIILPGVEIGPNSVIGAGSVVTRNIPSDVVAAGNPAKIICTVEEYAEKSLEDCLDFVDNNYSENKREKLLKIFPYPW